MDISQLKSRLASLQNPRGGQKKDFSLTIWKPTVGKHLVRIVPSTYNKSNPFKELFFHYGINNKTMISPTSYGEKDPIVEFAQGLRKSDDWQSAKKFEPKLRVFVPVIVRGEEEKGVNGRIRSAGGGVCCGAEKKMGAMGVGPAGAGPAAGEVLRNARPPGGRKWSCVCRCRFRRDRAASGVPRCGYPCFPHR